MAADENDAWYEEVARLMKIDVGQPQPGPTPDEIETAELRTRLSEELRRYVPEKATSEDVAPGSVPGELVNLIMRADSLADTVAIVSLEILRGLGEQVAAIGTELSEERDKVSARKKDAEDLTLTFSGLVVPVGATVSERDEIEAVRDAGIHALATIPLDDDAVDIAKAGLSDAQDAVHRSEEAARNRVRASDIRKDESDIKDIPGWDDAEQKLFADSRDEIDVALKSDPLTEDALGSAEKALKRLQAAAPKIAEAIKIRVEAHNQIERDGKDINESGYLDDQKKRLVDARQTLDEALKDPITADRNKQATAALSTLREIAKGVSAEIVAFGGQDGIEGLCKSAGIEAKAFAQLEEDLGGRKDLTALLTTFPTAELGALCKEIPPKDLKRLIDGFGNAGEVKSTVNALGGSGGMKKLLENGKPVAEIKTICTEPGAGFVGQLLKGRDGKAVAELHGAFGKDIKAFTDLAKDAGLAEKPEAMLAIYATGCEGKADIFRDFCKGFTNEKDRNNLKNLVDVGGLGDAPDALGALVFFGV